jgi:hypothetical protein
MVTQGPKYSYLANADGGDALYMWVVAANTVNKQSWTADKGRSFGFGVELGANNSTP